MDNQLRHGTTTGGLVYFVYKSEEEIWSDANWATWPYFLNVQDCASNNLCSHHALERHWDVNTDMIGDWAHGANRDAGMTLKYADLKQFWDCMCVSMNVPFGPLQDDGWSDLLRSVLDHCKGKRSPLNTPLFSDGAPRMLQQLQQAGVELEVGPTGDPEVALWDFVMEQGLERRAGSKITNCRFQSGTASAEKNLPHWGIDKFIRTSSF